MKQNSKLIFIQFIWLAICGVLTILLSLMFFGKNILSDSVAIHLHDTYFLIDSFSVLLATFLLITFLIFFAKGFRYSFRDSLPIWILVITGLALILSLTFLVNTFSGMNLESATLKSAEQTQDSVIQFIPKFFIILQFLIISALLFVVYSWGRGKQIIK